MRNTMLIVSCIAAVTCCMSSLQAQEYFYKIYQFETPYQGHVQLSLWNTYISNSNQVYEHFGKNIPDNHLAAHSIEAEFGLMDHLELDVYADFTNSPSNDFKYIRSHVSALYRIGERFDHFVNIGIYGEYYFPVHNYSASQEAELRLILDKDIEDFRFVVNPTISKVTTGNDDKSLHPGLAAAAYYRRHAFVQPGVEFYENFKEKTSVLFPTLVFNLSPAIIWNVAAGFGLNNKSDKNVFKSILTFDIEAVRPSKLFRKKLYDTASKNQP
jgi:hypothetical protein